MTLSLTSTAFTSSGPMPARYTCDGEDRSPALQWSGVPDDAQSLVLIVDDPDAPDPAAPKRTWVHWVIYDLSPQSSGLPEGAGNSAAAAPARAGLNDWSKPVWGGPCPPIGRHRYFFKLYALDVELGAIDSPTKAAVEKAMAGHVVAQAELIGTFQK